MNGEEPTGIEEQAKDSTQSPEAYQALKAQLEAERAKARELVEQATQDLKATIAAYQQELEAKARDIEALKAQVAALSTDLEGAKAAYVYAVEDFKKLAAASNPLIPAEALYGTTVDEVKAALERASRLAASIRQAMSEQAARASIPAGAPARSLMPQGMSTREKINVGLEQARRRKE